MNQLFRMTDKRMRTISDLECVVRTKIEAWDSFAEWRLKYGDVVSPTGPSREALQIAHDMIMVYFNRGSYFEHEIGHDWKTEYDIPEETFIECVGTIKVILTDYCNNKIIAKEFKPRYLRLLRFVSLLEERRLNFIE